MNLRIVVDRNQYKIIFAEAAKDFVDFLASLSAIPFGQILKLLAGSNDSIGNFGNFYRSCNRVGDDFFTCHRKRFFNPCVFTNMVPPLLPIDRSCLAKPTITEYFGCPSLSCGRHMDFISKSSQQRCPPGPDPNPAKDHNLTVPMYYHEPMEPSPNDRGLVSGGVTYMILDNLSVRQCSYTEALALVWSTTTDLRTIAVVDVEFNSAKALELLKHVIRNETCVLSRIFQAELNSAVNPVPPPVGPRAGTSFGPPGPPPHGP